MCPPPPGPLCALVASGSKCPPAACAAVILPSLSAGAQSGFSWRWNPCSPGASPFSFGSIVTPSLASLTVMVPIDFPTPSGVTVFIVTFTDLAANAAVPPNKIDALVTKAIVLVIFILAPLDSRWCEIIIHG